MPQLSGIVGAFLSSISADFQPDGALGSVNMEACGTSCALRPNFRLLCASIPSNYLDSNPLQNPPILSCPGSWSVLSAPMVAENPTSWTHAVGFWVSPKRLSCVVSPCKTLFSTAPTLASRPVGPALNWSLTMQTTVRVGNGGSF